VAFSPNSAELASASEDCTVKIWDVNNGDCLHTLNGHIEGVNSVAFSPESTLLASVSWDHIVNIWDTSIGDCLQTLNIRLGCKNISFDTTGSYLHVSTGTIRIGASQSVSSTIAIDSQTPEYKGLGLSSDRTWITRNSENLLWLPSEYRAHCSAISGNIIGMKSSNGRVLILEIRS
jgi:WD40 repeat protein